MTRAARERVLEAPGEPGVQDGPIVRLDHGETTVRGDDRSNRERTQDSRVSPLQSFDADTGVIRRLEQWLEDRHGRILAYSRCLVENAATNAPGERGEGSVRLGELREPFVF